MLKRLIYGNAYLVLLFCSLTMGVGTAQANPVLSASGSTPWATILCKFSDATSVPHDKAWFEAFMGNTYPGIGDFFRENSYGQMNLDGSQVFGWYTLPSPKSAYIDSNDILVDGGYKLEMDCLAAADADVYYPNFVGFNLMFGENIGSNAGWTVGGSYNLDGMVREYGGVMSNILSYENYLHIIPHEMGHNYGLMHTGPYGGGYSSHWDPMSAGGMCNRYTENGCYALPDHFISYHKDQLGWILPARKFVASTGTTSQIFIERLAQPLSTTDYLMAQIPFGDSDVQFYTVEARRYAGYDQEIPGEAVIIHNVDKSRGDWVAQVVDADTTNTDPNDAGAMWTVGETYTDAERGISVSVDSMTSTGYYVTISNNSPLLPDLVVTAVSSTAASLVTGGSATVSVTIKNSGSVAMTASSTVGVYLSDDQTITGYDTLIGSITVAPLAAGESSTGLVNVAIPSDLILPRTYYLGAIADINGNQAERNEINNASVGTSVPVLQNTDLVMTAVSTDLTTLSSENLITVSSTVTNQGTYPTTAAYFYVGIYLSSDMNVTTSDNEIARWSVPSLAPGESSTNPYGMYITSSILPGTYYLGVIADIEGTQTEINETNNALTGQIVTVLPSVDLVMTAVSTTSTSMTIGGSPTNITTTVKNQGFHAATATFYEGIYLSVDPTITTADTFIGDRWVSSLAAGGIYTVDTAGSAPSTLAPGAYYLGVIADMWDSEKETNETNNALTGNLINVIAAPTVTTNPATSVTMACATLNGTINPNNSASTAWFDWGATTAYGNQTTIQPLGSGTTPISFNQQVCGLTPGATYHFLARGQNAAGTAPGGGLTVTTLPDNIAPYAPTGLTATAASKSQINLAWTASTDNIGVVGYKIERCTGSKCATFAQVGTSTTTTFNNTGLAARTTYRYRVMAYDAAGNNSGYSSPPASATTLR